jgi:2'-5' RNA ligase
MVAFFLPAQVASQLYEAYKTQFDQPGFEVTPVDELHLTLAYLGDTADGTIDNQTREIVLETLKEYSKEVGIISGKVSSQTGKFENQGENVCWAGFNSPDLAAFRQGLVDALAANGVTVASDYGFTPHITLCYVPSEEPQHLTYPP